MNGSPSAIVTLGLGSWGSPSLILTLGYGTGAAVSGAQFGWLYTALPPNFGHTYAGAITGHAETGFEKAHALSENQQ